MNQVEIVLIIQRPVEEVFAFAEDVENLASYSRVVKAGRAIDPGPTEVGSRAVTTGSFLGRTFELTWETVDYVPDRRLASKTVSGPFRIETSTTFEALGGSTRVTSVYRGESGGFFKLAEPIAFRLARKQFEESARAMKELLERDDPTSS